MYPHRIRLRGPWEAEPIIEASDSDRLLARPVTLPCRWDDLRPSFRGSVVFRRRFGLPRQLDEWERVWLTCAKVNGHSEWSLNGSAVTMATSPDGGLEAEVTSLLCGRNELAVRVEGAEPDSGLYGEVALEVRCRAYLRGVRASVHPSETGWVVQVAGVVISERPGDALELYLLIDGKNHDYVRLQSDACETPFLFMAPIEERFVGERVELRVDLVNTATIWHTTELAVTLGERLDA